MSPAPPLAGRRALVVGGGRDLGAAVAGRLAADGATLLLVGRDARSLRGVQARLDGSGHDHLAADLTDPADLSRLCAHLHRIAPVDVVVTGLRVREPWTRLEHTGTDALADALADNVAYLADLIRAVLPGQRRTGFGRWVVLSSAVAALGGEGQGAYVAQKAALEGLVRTLALEEGAHGITANVVAPGFVDTDATRTAYPPEVAHALGAANALGRAVRPAEVAHAVAALAHPDAGAITGTTLPVTGGTELGWAIGAAVREARRTAAGDRPDDGEEERTGAR